MNRREFENAYTYELVANSSKAYLFNRYNREAYNIYSRPYVATVDLTCVDSEMCIVGFNGVTYQCCADLVKAINTYNSLRLFHPSTYYPVLTPYEQLNAQVTYYMTKVLGLKQCKVNTISNNTIINKNTFYLNGNWGSKEILTYVKFRYDALLTETDRDNIVTGWVDVVIDNETTYSMRFKGIEEALGAAQYLMQVKYLGMIGVMYQTIGRFNTEFTNPNEIEGTSVVKAYQQLTLPVTTNVAWGLEWLAAKLKNNDPLSKIIDR